MSRPPSKASLPRLTCVPESNIDVTVPHVDVSQTFWWPRRVFGSRANVAGYRPEPVVLRTLVTNVGLDAKRCRLEPTGGPVVALCADLARFLVALEPPELAPHGPDDAAELGVPVVRIPGWLSTGVRIQRVNWAYRYGSRGDAGARDDSVRSDRHGRDVEKRLSAALRFLEELHAAWDQSFDSLVIVGWPVHLPRNSGPALLDACTGQAILQKLDQSSDHSFLLGSEEAM